MAWNDYFQIANLLAMVGWAILIFCPQRWGRVHQLPALVIPLVLSAGYLVLVAMFFVSTGGGYGSIDSVRQLLSSDGMLLAGWVHYLAFDLVIGAWIAKQFAEMGTSKLIQVPILIATFQFGPVGFLLFQAVRTGRAVLPLKTSEA